ncbi:hypothetical protein ACFSRY_00295 [Pontibacter locisalis]|uniref:Uncharacterized protein n=1 Tax=Pontibacter locisalis TaxID=1719035 RepID=A0ABW5IFC5_9BACT
MKTNYKTIDNLIDNPSEISEVIKNPQKYGMDFWDELSEQHKSYVVFAAAAGLLMYGLYLYRQGSQMGLEENNTNQGELSQGQQS